jgi:hypothetical protein
MLPGQGETLLAEVSKEAALPRAAEAALSVDAPQPRAAQQQRE